MVCARKRLVAQGRGGGEVRANGGGEVGLREAQGLVWHGQAFTCARARAAGSAPRRTSRCARLDHGAIQVCARARLGYGMGQGARGSLAFQGRGKVTMAVGRLC